MNGPTVVMIGGLADFETCLHGQMINHNTKRPARWLMTPENRNAVGFFVFDITKSGISSLGNIIMVVDGIRHTRFPPVHRTSMVIIIMIVINT